LIIGPGRSARIDVFRSTARRRAAAERRAAAGQRIGERWMPESPPARLIAVLLDPRIVDQGASNHRM
jgi:hypothetical protein